VLAIAAGTAGLGWIAPHHSVEHSSRATLAIVLAAFAAASLAPYVIGRRGRPPGTLIAAGAGFAFAGDGLTTKFMTDDLSGRAWPGFAAWLVAMGAFAAIGTLSELSALQTSPVTQVAPVVFLLDTLIPIGLAPVLAGETWRSTPLTVIFVVAVLAGGVVLTRSRAVVALTGESSGWESEVTPRESLELRSVRAQSQRRSRRQVPR
jgi:hypothetical protein